jgi:hypothetical protein
MVPPLPKVSVDPSVPVQVTVLLTVTVFALAIVKVPVDVVNVKLLMVPGRTTFDGSENVHVTALAEVQVPVRVI